MASSSADQVCMPMERFEQRAVIKLCANIGMTPTHTHGEVLVTIIVGTRVLHVWRSFLTETSDFEKIERTSATISGVGALRTFRLLSFRLHLSGLSSEELKFAVCSAMARFGVDFYKDISTEWVERHMKCAAYGGSYFEKE